MNFKNYPTPAEDRNYVMSPAPIAHHDDAETAAFVDAVQEGIADAEAGRTVPYGAVREWLLSWGTEHKKPAPHCE